MAAVQRQHLLDIGISRLLKFCESELYLFLIRTS
jgi:hypothetical protein